MLISLYSCDSHKLDTMQARLDSVLGLRRTMSRDSIVSFAGSMNPKKDYKFGKGHANIGVTAEMIAQKEQEIQDILKTQHPAASNQIDGSTSADPNPVLHPQLPEVGNPSGARTSPIVVLRKKLMRILRSLFKRR